MSYTSVCLIAMLTDVGLLSSGLERCVTITAALLKQKLSEEGLGIKLLVLSISGVSNSFCKGIWKIKCKKIKIFGHHEYTVKEEKTRLFTGDCIGITSLLTEIFIFPDEIQIFTGINRNFLVLFQYKDLSIFVKTWWTFTHVYIWIYIHVFIFIHILYILPLFVYKNS